MKKIDTYQIMFWCIALVAGVLDARLLVGSRHLNPHDLSWLSGDSAQSEIGWEFLRHEKIWTFPLTWVGNLDYPTGVSASYLDFIPLMAVLFRPFAGLLPEDFQYLGIYTILCCVLQTYFGLRIMSLFANRDWLITLLGAGFFLFSPIMTVRLAGHFPHSSHWIILACIYYYFRRDLAGTTITRYMIPFVIMNFLAGAISPYMALFAGVFGLAAVLRLYIESRAVDHSHAGGAGSVDHAHGAVMPATSYLKWVFLLFTTTVVSFMIFGFVVIGGSQFAGGGYPDYSLNLLGPLNPVSKALYFRTLPSLSPEQAFEGYNYLGMGTILLLVIAVSRKPEIVRSLRAASLIPLTIASTVLTILAISVAVSLGSHLLFTIPVPHFVFNVLSIFRASGRLFWPVYYLLTLGGIVGIIVAVPNRTARRCILAVALLIQYFDLLPLREGVATISARVFSTPLTQPDWQQVPHFHRHLVVLPAMQCRADVSPGGLAVWPFFARLAARGGMTLNSAYLARESRETLFTDCEMITSELLQHGFHRDTAYVLSDQLAVHMVLKGRTDHYCRRVDGFNLCTYDPKRSDQSKNLADVVAPFYERGTELRSELPTPRSLLTDHIDTHPSLGRWTTDSVTTFDFRVRDIAKPAALLNIEISNANIGRRHLLQRVFVFLNDKYVGELVFRRANVADKRVMPIPGKLFRYGELNELKFVLPDAVAPRDLGINTDGRPLALYVHRLSIS
ncbi:MAG TPA: DUF6311 domain-containing protein [Rhizomicrobium sp.]|nr:DUF6311 domain-containing protein [Rhizomicrobium sp.]